MKSAVRKGIRERNGRPREGAWIEIIAWPVPYKFGYVAPARGRGLKYGGGSDLDDPYGRPREGAWIEILARYWYPMTEPVAPARGRGLKCCRLFPQLSVYRSPPRGGVD